MVNTKKLKCAIAGAGHTQITLAKKLGITPNSLSNKLRNKSEFTVEELLVLIQELGIVTEDFFYLPCD